MNSFLEAPELSVSRVIYVVTDEPGDYRTVFDFGDVTDPWVLGRPTWVTVNDPDIPYYSAKWAVPEGGYT